MVKEIGININLEETKESLKALYDRTKEPIYLELYNYYNGIKTVPSRDSKRDKTKAKPTQPSLFGK